MNIAQYFSPLVLIASFAVAIVLMLWLGKSGVIVGFFDPFILLHLQLIFTTILLGVTGILPLAHLFFLVAIYIVWFYCWRDGFIIDQGSESDGWVACVWILVLFSIPANAYLVATKGFILLQSDVGLAKVEYYQGAGLIRRVNTVLAGLLPVYVFKSWTDKGRWSAWLTVGLLYSAFVVLSLGSKAGITSIAFSFGAVLYFRRNEKRSGVIGLIMIASILSSLAMFYVVYGDSFIFDLGVRLAAFADGPFYYYKDRMSIDVPYGYPLYVFAFAARLVDSLPIASLGPEINWRYFGLNDDLFGPNPQISVESVAIFGAGAPFYYIIFGGVLFIFSRFVGNPYSFVMWAAFVRSFPVDSQLAFSNLYNIIFVYIVFAIGIILSRLLVLAARNRKLR